MAILGAVLGFGIEAASVPYPVVYVAAPRPPEPTQPAMADSFTPVSLQPGSTLRIQYPDGRNEVLVDPGTKGAIADPMVSFDGLTVYYSRCDNVADLRGDIQSTPATGCDIEAVALATKQTTRLTHQERDEPSAYPVYNMGPTPVAGNRLVFTSNRRNLYPPKGFGQVTMQLHAMSVDGTNVQNIMPMSIGGVLHPFPLTNGHICFSTKESQGLRDRRVWGIWCSFPDGRAWYPIVSAFMYGQVFHFATQISSGDIIYENYYNQNDLGFGMFEGLPLSGPLTGPAFGPADARANGPIQFADHCGRPTAAIKPFTWKGSYSVTPWTNFIDEASPVVNPADCATNGPRVGKVTMPSAAPGNQLLLVYSSGPVNLLRRPTSQPPLQSGIYLAPAGGVTASPSQLSVIVDDPNVNELWPRAVVPYSAIYGIASPPVIPFLPNDGTVHPILPPGTPYGVVGTASVFNRESAPGFNMETRNYQQSGLTYDGLEPFNLVSSEIANPNWTIQGADTRVYPDSDIAAIRILLMEPNREVNHDAKWKSWADERLRILGEVPINRDGSFAAIIPADLPFSFQLLDRDGLMLTMAQTWHQVRPGEIRVDCGGCHAHSKPKIEIGGTLAVITPPANLTRLPARDVEYRRDIDPIVQRACVSCHQGTGPGGLAFSGDPFANYRKLADAQSENLPAPGYPTAWLPPNVSKFVRVFNASRSLLMWTLSGRRLDGWTNDRWPGTPLGPISPADWARYMSDQDFQPGGTDHAHMVSDAERRLVAAWIDLGAPLDRNGSYFADANRPTLAITRTAVHTAIIGAADGYSGLDAASLRITVNGTETTPIALSDGRWSITLPDGPSSITASISDKAGNRNVLTRTLVFSPLPTH